LLALLCWRGCPYNHVIFGTIWHMGWYFQTRPVSVNPFGRHDHKSIYLFSLIEQCDIVDADFTFACTHLHEISPYPLVPGSFESVFLVLVWRGLELIFYDASLLSGLITRSVARGAPTRILWSSSNREATSKWCFWCKSSIFGKVKLLNCSHIIRWSWSRIGGRSQRAMGIQLDIRQFLGYWRDLHPKPRGCN